VSAVLGMSEVIAHAGVLEDLFLALSLAAVALVPALHSGRKDQVSTLSLVG
jgi:hypothetical protein